MPRNKTGSRTAKRQNTTSPLATIKQMEKDFSQAPAQLAAHISKEIAAHKQQQNKLKNALEKTKAQAKTSEKRMKSMKGNKKQLTAAKKAHAEVIKTQTGLTKQLQDVAHSLESFSAAQAKTVALRKALAQFDKDWAKNVKKLEAKAKAKAKSKKKKVKSARKQISDNAMQPATEQTQTHSFESMIDDVKQDETFETSLN